MVKTPFFKPYDILILTATIGSFLLAVFLFLKGEKELAGYVSIWVPSLIGVGIYIKLIRLRHFLLKNIIQDILKEKLEGKNNE
tara:strand:- start:272 stop:520 length:249 start_codon:yes stop_codon:yes gene_type:complete